MGTMPISGAHLKTHEPHSWLGGDTFCFGGGTPHLNPKTLLNGHVFLPVHGRSSATEALDCAWYHTSFEVPPV
eukprot:2467294-Amphidinium_carterae.1